jgi:DNA-binding Lrp family transcriptional regulator
MHLTDFDRALLANLHGEAAGCAAVFSSPEARARHAQQYGIEGLLERGVLTPRCSVNVGALGFKSYVAYFSFKPAPPTEIEEAVGVVREHPYVSSLVELSGSFHFACTVLAKDISQALLIYGDISERMKLPWHRKTFVERYLLTVWPLKCASNVGTTEALVFPPAAPQATIDALDHEILKHKARSPLLSHQELSDALNEPLATIDERIKALQAKRIINGCGYVINWEGIEISPTEVSVTVNRIDAALIDALVEFGRRNSLCCSVAGCLGTWDFQFTVLTETPDALHGFTSELWQRFGDFIESLHVTAYSQRLRDESYPFLELAVVMA